MHLGFDESRISMLHICAPKLQLSFSICSPCLTLLMHLVPTSSLITNAKPPLLFFCLFMICISCHWTKDWCYCCCCYYYYYYYNYNNIGSFIVLLLEPFRVYRLAAWVFIGLCLALLGIISLLGRRASLGRRLRRRMLFLAHVIFVAFGVKETGEFLRVCSRLLSASNMISLRL